MSVHDWARPLEGTTPQQRYRWRNGGGPLLGRLEELCRLNDCSILIRPHGPPVVIKEPEIPLPEMDAIRAWLTGYR